MLLLKASVVLLFTVACYADSTQTSVPDPKDSYNHELNIAPEPAKSSSTTIKPVDPVTNHTSTQSPNTTSTTTLKPNTSTPAPPTTSKPNTTTSTPAPSTTTPKPNTTTSTPAPSTTTPKPSPTPSPSPNSTTTVSPDPPAQPRNWDGPSFMGGMVLAFGIVAVGFVGYRFFYLGRGGAYHTL